MGPALDHGRARAELEAHYSEIWFTQTSWFAHAIETIWRGSFENLEGQDSK